MDKIRYGIIGCGSMGREHIENIQALPRTEGGASVTALADPHGPSRDAALAIARDGPRVFGDHRELLASGLCDAVVIATPNFTHAAMMRDALAADVHILAERALQSSMEIRRININFALMNERFLLSEKIFNRVFYCEDVLCARLVDAVYHRRECG